MRKAPKEGDMVRDLITGELGTVRREMICGDVIIVINGVAIRRQRKQVKVEKR